MDSPVELIAVRHGESVANAAFRDAELNGLTETGLTGRDADVALSPRGEQQSRAFGHWLTSLAPARLPEVVYCSPFRRARQTLSITGAQMRAAGRDDLPAPVVDDRLRDRDTGVLELLTPAAIRSRYPREAKRATGVGELRYRPPGGESLLDVAERVRAALAAIGARHRDQRVLVMAHDAVVLMLRRVIEGLSDEEVHRVVAAGPVLNTSITRWRRRDGSLHLVEYNQHDHLAAPVPAGGDREQR